MSDALLFAVDGGNSKTDAVLLRADGGVLAARRGPGSNPHFAGIEGAVDIVGQVLDAVRHDAGVGVGDTDQVISLGAYFLAGADQPDEIRDLHAAIARRRWSDQLLVDNDVLALLWAGSDTGSGVAVVVGAGINALGRSEAGATARFAALGEITGDWGGGADIGGAALGAGVRGEDGRGPATSLSTRVAAFFGESAALDVALAIHRGRIPGRRLGELAPLVFAAAVDGDAEALTIVDRQADEVVRFAVAALRRMDRIAVTVKVVLGGSVLTAAPARLIDRVRAQVAEVAPLAEVVVCTRRPIVGAAIAALKLLGAGDAALERLRGELTDDRIATLPPSGMVAW